MHTVQKRYFSRLAGAITRTPVVFTYHGFPFHDFMPVWQKNFHINLERVAKPLTRYYVTLSERDRRAGIELGFIKAIESRAIYTGIDFAEPDRPVDIAAKQQVNTRRLFSACFCRPLQNMPKAPDILVNAFAKVRHSYPNCLLLLVGDGELTSQMKELVASLQLQDVVYFLGMRQDVPEILQEFGCICLFITLGSNGTSYDRGDACWQASDCASYLWNTRSSSASTYWPALSGR